MPMLLLEDCLGEFVIDRTKGSRGIVIEHANSASPVYKVPGRLSICNIKNGNNRRYPTKVWENNLKLPESKLRRLIEKNRALGLLEHPDDGRVTLLSPICAITTKADLVEDGKDLVVDGEITIVNTMEGQKLKALIEAGYNPLVSSRGYGSLARANDGVDEVQEDYVCEGWDVVHTPSFEQAELRPQREEPIVVRESVTPPISAAPIVTPPVTAAPISPTVTAEGEKPKPTSSPAQPKPKISNAMELKEIRAQLDSVKASVAAGKPDHRAITESIGRCDELHREVAKWQAEDNTRSWDGTKLHEEIKGIETRLTTIQQAPTQELTKLRENQVKLLQVTKVAAERAVDYRKKLGESIARNSKVKELSTKLLERGRAWKSHAETLTESNEDLDFQLDVVSESLDMLVEMYNADVCKLSKKLMTSKFGDKITPAIKERLDKATHPKEVYAIHEELAAAVAPPVTDPNAKPGETTPPVVGADGKPIVAAESKIPGTAPKTPIVEGAKPPVTSFITAVKDPRSLSESVEIAKRLSSALVAA